MKLLISYLGAEKIVIMLTALLAVTSTTLAVLAPWVLAKATDTIFDGVRVGDVNFSRIGTILLTVVALHAVNILFNYLQGFIMVGVSARITYKLRTQISNKITSSR